eukprot:gene18122-27910_t
MPVKRAKFSDLLDMQHCNLNCLPENYGMKYYLYHAVCWRQLSYVNQDFNGKVNGYVLAKMEEDTNEEEGIPEHGHITSLSVLRTARQLGSAARLVKCARQKVEDVFDGKYLSLHVRCSNAAAIKLYQEKLEFKVHEIDLAYYGDGEDAFQMKWLFDKAGDPFGATIVQVPTTPEIKTGKIEWPSTNVDGRIKYHEHLKRLAQQQREAAAKKQQEDAAPKRSHGRRGRK